MKIDGFEVTISIKMPDKTVKTIETLEELRKYAPQLNGQSMKSIGAVPVSKEKVG